MSHKAMWTTSSLLYTLDGPILTLVVRCQPLAGPPMMTRVTSNTWLTPG